MNSEKLSSIFTSAPQSSQDLPQDFLHYLTHWPNMLRDIPYFFRNFLDALPAAVYLSSYDIRNNKWVIRYVSEGVERLLGYKASELENKVSFKALVMSNVQHYHLFEKGLTPAASNFRLTFEFRDANGEGKWCSDDGIIIFDQEGQVCGSLGVFVDITEHKEKERDIEEENKRLKTALKTPSRLGGMVGRSTAMQSVYSRILKMALSSANLVILGESGTGKELAARAIHDMSNRSAQNFIAVNCSSISANLFESEFFGHKKGSFTGALNDRQGYFDSAKGGTLFLDEVGEIPLNIQTKLLRTLDGYGYIRVGDNMVRHSDFHLITATNRNLELLIQKGLMREDFYYRINSISMHLPPLRKRLEDIPLLINDFLARKNMTVETLPPEFLKKLMEYSWPGNIRELHNVMLRYVAFQETELEQTNNQDSHQVLPDFTLKEGFNDLSPELPLTGQRPNNQQTCTNYIDFEHGLILKTLNDHQWTVGEAAKSLGLSRSTFYRKMKKHGLSKS